jgi:hypothetical protein
MKPWLLSSLLLLFATQCLGSVVAISTTILPSGTVGSAFSAVVQANGGCAPYNWSIVSGTLPPGITASPSITTDSLDFSGTPSQEVFDVITVAVTDCSGASSQSTYRVIVLSTANHVVDLSWSGSTSNDVAGYNLYRSQDTRIWELINTSLIASTVYSDSTVANGSRYFYEATAVDINGNESVRTDAVEVVIP